MVEFEIRRGDIFFVDFNPSQGFEIKGKRPAVVIQNDIGNRFGGTIIVAAMTTNTKKQMPVHVVVEPKDSGLLETGVILLDQIRVITRTRFDKKQAGRVSESKMLEVDAALRKSLGLS